MRHPPFRRPRRFPIKPILVNKQKVLPPKAHKANQLFKQREYKEAAVLFEELFSEAEKRNAPIAPKLALQTGFAWLKAEEKEKGIQIIKEGFGIWVSRKQWIELHKGYRISVARLKGDGFTDEADELEKWVIDQVPDSIKNLPVWENGSYQTTAPAKKKLPSVCPQCGAPVDPKEVEWFNDEIAQCPFCNVILNSEN